MKLSFGRSHACMVGELFCRPSIGEKRPALNELYSRDALEQQLRSETGNSSLMTDCIFRQPSFRVLVKSPLEFSSPSILRSVWKDAVDGFTVAVRSAAAESLDRMSFLSF